ncbi:Pyridoxamine 5'-phosphate oxidase [Streptomyces sp. ADI96-02]|uniref:pyridoxamine 5'-phosphate oxidase family protein n=1 Tax=unclassified Streptomyces TaxID=2593676 RepID=UPI000F552D06|nr:pyridoxamine 5'-phosphate oxidase family protein [Streptomyces sp. ADI96-02]RPK65846.1 Pyridoxamine 5'-phosphate oxidase [Streptomyces sp. ADI96-02]
MPTYEQDPVVELDARYSGEDARPGPWPETAAVLASAPLYWLSTVRPDGRPHVTPLIGVWSHGALHFSTGPEERKAHNLRANPEAVLTTGANTLDAGLDVVVEGRAERVTEHGRLTGLAREWEAKYGGDWRFGVEDGAFTHSRGTGRALVFAVSPRTVFGFGKGEPFSQTRYRFPERSR